MNEINRDSEKSSVTIPFDRTFPKFAVDQGGNVLPVRFNFLDLKLIVLTNLIACSQIYRKPRNAIVAAAGHNTCYCPKETPKDFRAGYLSWSQTMIETK